jgi:hypothetical protein
MGENSESSATLSVLEGNIKISQRKWHLRWIVKDKYQLLGEQVMEWNSRLMKKNI